MNTEITLPSGTTLPVETVSTVISFYQVFVGRQPDLAGLEFWTSQLEDGLSLNDFADAFAEANEFQEQFGERTSTEIVFALFRNVLGREPDFAGLTFWTDQVDSGNLTLADLGRFFATSPEAQDRFEPFVEALLDDIESTDPESSLFDVELDAPTSSVDSPLSAADGGGSGDDIIAADAIFDSVDGGAGTDALLLTTNDGFFTGGILTGGSPFEPEVTGVENITLTSQFDPGFGGDNNLFGSSIDAGSIVGLERIENYDSRDDLVVEDIRDDTPEDGTFTADLTAAVVGTDPGNVDTALYFDQPVNVSSTDTTGQITFTVLDQEAAAGFTGTPTSSTAGLLTELAITSFRFSLDGQDVEVDLPVTDAFGPAFTFEDLGDLILEATTEALTDLGLEDSLAGVSFGAPVEVGVGNQETVPIILEFIDAIPEIDPLDNISFTSVDQNGNNASDPAVQLEAGAETVVIEDLISLNVEFDDVGRGSTGGDFLAGALSTGFQGGGSSVTSDSLGIQQFDIEVDRSSILQTINSTNNSLEVVNITNGENDGVFNTTGAADEQSGDLTVRGRVSDAFGGGGFGEDDAHAGAVVQHNDFGFSDVGVINGSSFIGDLDLTAELTTEIVEKFLTLDDTGATGDEDDFLFDYDLGTGDDELFLNLDADALTDAGTASREDFNLAISGNGGDDVIVTNIGFADKAIDGQGQDYYETFESGAFYANQANNDAASLVVSGGAGDDSIWTIGWGDAVITGGAGDDIVFTDNSRAANNADIALPTLDRNIGEDTQIDYALGAIWTFNDDFGGDGFINGFGGVQGSTNTGIVVGTAVSAQSPTSTYVTSLTIDFSGAGGSALAGTDRESTVVIDQSVINANGAITEQELNQAIKDAINTDSVLSSVLEAVDGPGQSLVVYSKIDGTFIQDDLTISVQEVEDPLTGANTTLDFTPASYASTSASTDFQNFAFDSTAESDNVVIVTADATQEDVIVLSTNDSFTGTGPVLNGASNEIIRFADGNGFGEQVVFNFDAELGDAAAGLSGADDAFDFLSIDYTQAAANFANGSVNTLDNSISVFTAPSVTTNVAPLGQITAAEIADLYNTAATTTNTPTEHIAILYSESVGRVFSVTDIAGAGNATAVELGEIDLIGTGWANLEFDNFL